MLGVTTHSVRSTQWKIKYCSISVPPSIVLYYAYICTTVYTHITRIHSISSTSVLLPAYHFMLTPFLPFSRLLL